MMLISSKLKITNFQYENKLLQFEWLYQKTTWTTKYIFHGTVTIKIYYESALEKIIQVSYQKTWVKKVTMPSSKNPNKIY